MGYSVCFDGNVNFTETAAAERFSKAMSEIIGAVAYDSEFDGTHVMLFGTENSHNDSDWYRELDKEKEFLLDGEILFSGEDNSFWKIEISNGKWREVQGSAIWNYAGPWH